MAVYLEDGTPAPIYPVAGQRLMPLKTGNVVDVVYQNLAANANGDLLHSSALEESTQSCIMQPSYSAMACISETGRNGAV